MPGRSGPSGLRQLLPVAFVVALVVIYSSQDLLGQGHLPGAGSSVARAALENLEASERSDTWGSELRSGRSASYLEAAAPPKLNLAVTHLSSTKVGFYLHIATETRPDLVVQQVREVKQHFPNSKIFVMSDGGVDLSAFCKEKGCIFALCPPANDLWHPWPFFRRLYDAALVLNTEYLAFLDQHVVVHNGISKFPPGSPEGPWVPASIAAWGLPTETTKVMEMNVTRLGRERVPNFNWTRHQMLQLGGGTLFWSEALLDALTDERVMRLDWNRLALDGGIEIFSFSVALNYALAARGWSVKEWDAVSVFVGSGSPDATFLYKKRDRSPPPFIESNASDEALISPRLAQHDVVNGDCQVCYNLNRYIENWGSEKCTNRIPFNYSMELLQKYHPELAEGCTLPTLCKTDASLQRRPSDTTYGFYLHVYADPAAVIFQVRQLRKFFPNSPIYIMSDGGMDFTPLCKQQGCTFVLCPPANDRWHPWPFFKRLVDAAENLQTEYVIMLEPDNTIHSRIRRPPTHDAGGIYVKDRAFGLVEYVEKMARQRVPGFNWNSTAMSAGLAGGAYFRREAILDAFSDENMMKLDWNLLGERATKEVYSSDFAMQYALAARGWHIAPWDDAAQMDKDKNIPLTGPGDAAFRHYCSCYPGGKPTYNVQLKTLRHHHTRNSFLCSTSPSTSYSTTWWLQGCHPPCPRKEDQKLFLPQPPEYARTNSVCQLCYNLSRYVDLWGSTRCTNEIPFSYSKLLLQRYHPEILQGKCELPWLCEPEVKK